MSGKKRDRTKSEKMLQSHMDVCRAMQRRHAMKKTMHTVMHIDCMYVYVSKTLLSPVASQTCLSLTLHYAVRSVIHARTGSVPPQKKGDSQQPDATGPDPEHQH